MSKKGLLIIVALLTVTAIFVNGVARAEGRFAIVLRPGVSVISLLTIQLLPAWKKRWMNWELSTIGPNRLLLPNMKVF